MIPTKEQLDKINLISELQLEQEVIGVFKVKLCDTNISEHYHIFDLKTMLSIAHMSIGKIIKINDSLSAKIFDTEIENANLLVLAYIDKTHSRNFDEDSLREREISSTLFVENIECSICGSNRCQSPACQHKKGKIYDNKICYYKLSDISYFGQLELINRE